MSVSISPACTSITKIFSPLGSFRRPLVSDHAAIRQQRFTTHRDAGVVDQQPHIDALRYARGRANVNAGC